MKNIFARIYERARDPQYRDITYTVLSAICVFLRPLVGWNPFLLAWCGYLALLLKECTSKKIAIYYKIIIVLILIVVALNIAIGLFSLHFVLG